MLLSQRVCKNLLTHSSKKTSMPFRLWMEKCVEGSKSWYGWRPLPTPSFYLSALSWPLWPLPFPTVHLPHPALTVPTESCSPLPLSLISHKSHQFKCSFLWKWPSVLLTVSSYPSSHLSLAPWHLGISSPRLRDTVAEGEQLLSFQVTLFPFLSH